MELKYNLDVAKEYKKPQKYIKGKEIPNNLTIRRDTLFPKDITPYNIPNQVKENHHPHPKCEAGIPFIIF